MGLESVDTLVINVGGTSLSIAENFLSDAMFSQKSDIATKVIWNFYEATSIAFGAEFWGTVLAPYASVSNNNALNGSVVVASFTQGGEVHLPVFGARSPAPTRRRRRRCPNPAPPCCFSAASRGLAATRRRSRC